MTAQLPEGLQPASLLRVYSEIRDRFQNGAKECISALCRSRRELSNEYLLAKIGVDTAENEPLEVWRKIIQYYSFVSLGSA